MTKSVFMNALLLVSLREERKTSYLNENREDIFFCVNYPFSKNSIIYRPIFITGRVFFTMKGDIKMEVKLLTHEVFIRSMEHNAAYAMLTCHANTEKLESREPKFFIEKAIKMGHESVLEHITLTYEVNDLSRACLQELARHRHISLSVESTRHTLRDKLVTLLRQYREGFEFDCLEVLYKIGSLKYLSNDQLKYFIPEFWTTNLILTANIRELRHIVKLRTAPAALREFQVLAINFVEVLPDEFKYLLEDCVYKNEE